MGKRKKPKIGEIIKGARVRLQLKAEEVAEGCNVSRSRVYQWEASDHILPKNLSPLSCVLGIPVEKLREANRAPR